MFDNKLGCCPRTTVFVLDRSSRFSSLSKQHIDLDGSGKSKGAKSIMKTSSLGPVYKNAWTCSIEATVEYSRIVYDLFPNEYIVSMVLLYLVTKMLQPFETTGKKNSNRVYSEKKSLRGHLQIAKRFQGFPTKSLCKPIIEFTCILCSYMYLHLFVVLIYRFK